jgi:hypothetical protein
VHGLDNKKNRKKCSHDKKPFDRKSCLGAAAFEKSQPEQLKKGFIADQKVVKQ